MAAGSVCGAETAAFRLQITAGLLPPQTKVSESALRGPQLSMMSHTSLGMASGTRSLSACASVVY